MSVCVTTEKETCTQDGILESDSQQDGIQKSSIQQNGIINVGWGANPGSFVYFH
jgi:hypothetical protein